MGRALSLGWLNQSVVANSLVVVEPVASARAALSSQLTCVTSVDAIGQDRFDAVVFAVKPQQMPQLVSEYRRFKNPGSVFISIAAGRSLAFLAEELGADAAVVRAMPNTPAAIGQGITVLCANPAADPDQRGMAEQLLQSVGDVAWIDDEILMDAVTAVSGSGPAYVFLLIECLARAGADAGLPETLALQLARKTVAGAGQLALASPYAPSELRRQVTSPGGTTEAALAVLCQDEKLLRLVAEAVATAKARSEELSAEG
jgi:pyrroline-5-carboxylate reductase